MLCQLPVKEKGGLKRANFPREAAFSSLLYTHLRNCVLLDSLHAGDWVRAG